MMRYSRFALVALAGFLATPNLQAQVTYQLDNGTIGGSFNASDGSEPLDNWVGNVFTVTSGGTLINRVDWQTYTNAAGAIANVVLYKVTGAGGNPALGTTRVYTQSFTTVTGPGGTTYPPVQQIPLTTPQSFNVGDNVLVAIFEPNVIALGPNDKYPYVLDTSTSAAGTYWDRSAPNTFNLDDLSGAVPLDQALPLTGGATTPYIPGPHHVFIQAVGVPEPSTLALLGLAGGAATLFRRRRPRERIGRHSFFANHLHSVVPG